MLFLLMFARLGMDALPPKLLIQFAEEFVEKSQVFAASAAQPVSIGKERP